MTAHPHSAAAGPDPDPTGPVMESFFAVTFRRARYLVAIGLGAYLFHTVGWLLVAPTQVPGYATATLLLGTPAGGLLAAAGLLLLLLVCTALSMAVVHPDAPHIGMYCAGLGMAALTIRGGSLQLIASQAQEHQAAAALFRNLALESGVWLLIVVAAELTSLWLYARVFKNTAWLARLGSSPATPDLLRLHPADQPLVTLTLGRGPAAAPADTLASNAGALATTMLVGGLLLCLLAQTELKGQVLFACLASFAGAAFAAHQAFPRAHTLAIWVGVPLTALVGFALAGRWAFAYPGHVGLPLARALPSDYMAAGLPGAVLGYYSSLRMKIHQIVHEQ